MKLLINLCAHDGIISHYTGVGTMVQRYIIALNKIFHDKKIDYDLVLYTPEYAPDSFGYNEDVFKMHQKYPINMIPNGSNKKANYGTPENWETLTKNTADIINSIDITKYDKVITIYNDTPFACLANFLNLSEKHLAIWIPHSTAKIHLVDSAIENSEQFFLKRVAWEEEAINFINNSLYAYAGVIGSFITSHLENKYHLNKAKAIPIYNGEILNKKKTIFTKIPKDLEKYFNILNENKKIILSFSRAEQYKGLDKTMALGYNMNIPTIVIAQSYYKEQPILEEYRSLARKYKTNLFIDPPFNLASNILKYYQEKIILLVPSEKETMGLIINEIRHLKKSNILLVANDIDGLKEQIESGKDGLLVDLNNIDDSKKIILDNFNKKQMKKLCKNGYQRLKKDYNLINNMNRFISIIMGD